MTTDRRHIQAHVARARRVWKRYALLPVRRLQGSRFAKRIAIREWPDKDVDHSVGPLEHYFDEHTEGPGIWKWRHYFDIYDSHLSKFVGQPVNIVEIGIYSGGSLGMWRSYFGDEARVFGIDIEPACKAYESETVKVYVGDQADPHFWAEFRKEVPNIDVVIDDGGHEPHQQIATLEALLPHLRPGGVFICEDVIGRLNPFHAYVTGLTRSLNTRTAGTPTSFQRSVKSVSIYPYITVIERHSTVLNELVSPKHGTEWQPFLNTRLPDLTGRAPEEPTEK